MGKQIKFDEFIEEDIFYEDIENEDWTKEDAKTFDEYIEEQRSRAMHL